MHTTITTTFDVPGGIALQGRIYDPPASTSRGGVVDDNDAPRALCIIAHPYGPLGGSMDDPVVRFLARFFSSHPATTNNAPRLMPMRVVTFNARGVSSSPSSSSSATNAAAGRTSWTGKQEAQDYQHVVDISIKSFCERWPDARGVALFLCGYSAGSLHASQATAPDPLPVQFHPTDPNQPFRTRYILLSYPLGVLWALSLFRSSAYTSRVEALIQQQQDGGRSIQRTRNDVLLIFGDTDQFTARAKLDSFCNKLSTLAQTTALAPAPQSTVAPSSPSPSSSFAYKCIDGADHFWRSNSLLQQLSAALVEWIASLPS